MEGTTEPSPELLKTEGGGGGGAEKNQEVIPLLDWHIRICMSSESIEWCLWETSLVLQSCHHCAHFRCLPSPFFLSVDHRRLTCLWETAPCAPRGASFLCWFSSMTLSKSLRTESEPNSVNTGWGVSPAVYHWLCQLTKCRAGALRI